jgi:hypothetical protein
MRLLPIPPNDLTLTGPRLDQPPPCGAITFEEEMNT